MTVPIWLTKKYPKNYVIVTSHPSEVSNAPSNNLIRMSSVGAVDTYLYENVNETFCLGVVTSFTNRYVAVMSCLGAICSIYDIALNYYLGGVLTSPNQNVKVMPLLMWCLVSEKVQEVSL